jgi:protein-tyrosine phosphatase
VAGSALPGVVCVCTGNICRSVAMELYLARAWAGDAVLSSAGTMGLIGWHSPAPMRDALAAIGLDAGHHTARQLDAAEAEAADLVLVAAHHHRSWIERHAPAALPRTFLATEIAALAALEPRSPLDSRAERIRAAAGVFDAARQSRTVVFENIHDPYGRGHAAYPRAVSQIASVLESLVSWGG